MTLFAVDLSCDDHVIFKLSLVGKLANFPKRKKKRESAFGKTVNSPGKRR